MTKDKIDVLVAKNANKTINGVRLYTVYDFDYDMIKRVKPCKKPRGNGGHKKKSVLDIYVSFDIETSTIAHLEHSFMYVWQMGIETESCIIGRTWFEFKHCLQELAARVPNNTILKIWVHNLSFEFSFLKGIYRFTPDDVFILDGRRVAKCCILDKIEFYCSYIQTNMSLEMFTSAYEVEHVKLSGNDFDYSVIRYADTPLTDEELAYCVNDVIGLNEAMKKRCESYSDNLYTIPLTSTGYVRREVKRAMKNFPYTVLQDCLPDFETYELLEEAFRGGDTHANRHYTGKITGPISSFDIQSSYPFQMVCKKFPVTHWDTWQGECDEKTVEFLLRGGYALLLQVKLSNVSLRYDYWGSPYIAKHKCREISGGVFDNGRVLSADYLSTVITDIDLEIIKEQYKCDIEYIDIRFSHYGFLPDEIRDEVRSFFTGKTELKGIEEEKEEYNNSKALLNSIYGMMVQKPVKQSIDFLIEEELQFHLRDDDKRELFDKAMKKAFTSFAWGVWVTAHARHDLFTGQKICASSLVYNDTDCCKFLHDEHIIKRFEVENKKRQELAEHHGAYAKDKHGKLQYMGAWEYEGIDSRFVTLGAKKYAVENDGKIKITVAGVNKKKGGEELKKLGGLSAFKEGTIFRESGGVEAVYNDAVCEPIIYEGHKVLITDNVCLLPSTYTLGLTDEYRSLIALTQLKEY